MEPILPIDDRTDLQKLRRAELWKLADNHDIAYPNGATKDQMLSILAAYKINVANGIEWDEFEVKGEDGKPTRVRVPRRHPHYTKDKDIDYDSIIESKAEEGLKKENADLKAENEEIKKRLAALEEKEFSCDQCEKTFPTAQGLTVHKARAHGKDAS